MPSLAVSNFAVVGCVQPCLPPAPMRSKNTLTCSVGWWRAGAKEGLEASDDGGVHCHCLLGRNLRSLILVCPAGGRPARWQTHRKDFAACCQCLKHSLCEGVAGSAHHLVANQQHMAGGKVARCRISIRCLCGAAGKPLQRWIKHQRRCCIPLDIAHVLQ